VSIHVQLHALNHHIRVLEDEIPINVERAAAGLVGASLPVQQHADLFSLTWQRQVLLDRLRRMGDC